MSANDPKQTWATKVRVLGYWRSVGRREFIIVGGTAAGSALSRAQQPDRMRRIGVRVECAVWDSKASLKREKVIEE